jgi:3-hydroxymyristoyl/3-hydroxydecanoyl-(acyl carrier protein) dehydratase
MMCAPIVRAAVADAPLQVTVELDIPATLPCFDGHFPGFAVLAGVVQLDWVMQIGAAYLLCAQRAATDFRVKFKRVITPGSPLVLTVRHDTARRRLDFTYRTGGTAASQDTIASPGTAASQGSIASQGHVMLLPQ